MARLKFEKLGTIDAKHNKIHRLCFDTPYLLDQRTTAPTADDIAEGELLYCTADDKLYTKIGGVVKSSSAFS